MSNGETPTHDARQHPRLSLPPMYTVFRARPQGSKKFCWTGHLYDISAGGLRFEIDSPIKPGTPIEFRATLPSPNPTTINAQGHVVRYHDDPDEPGPVRMAMVIDKFPDDIDKNRLHSYLRDHGLPNAA